MNDSLTGLVILGGLILLSAVLKMAYVALINVPKPRLKELADANQARAARALALANDATRLLASQQLVDVLLRFAIALVAAVILVPPLRDALANQMATALANGLAYGGVLLIAAILTLIFGDMLPANIALGHAEAIATRSAGAINVLSYALAPALRLLQWISGKFAEPFVGRSGASLVTEEEIMMMVDAGSEEGVIEDEEKEMIYSIFQFGDKVVREIMVPRIDIAALDADTSLHQALDTVLSEGHSRIPVYEGSVDRICGLLYAKDLLVVWKENQSKDRKVREIIRPAYFVPESKKAGSLLQELQERKIHMAIVIDEYGGTAGLVTIEDLVEEIVGEIQDEYDPDEEAEYEKINDDEYLFDAGIHLDDVNELLDVHLPEDESDTLGGYVLGVLGRVPLGGEVFQEKNLEIKVEAITGRRIRKVRVRRLPPPVEHPGESDEEQKSEEPVPDNTRTFKPGEV